MTPFIFLLLICTAIGASTHEYLRVIPLFCIRLKIEKMAQSPCMDKLSNMQTVSGLLLGVNITTFPNELGLEAQFQNNTSQSFLSKEKTGYGNIGVNLHGPPIEGPDLIIYYTGIIPKGMDAIFSLEDYHVETSPSYSISGSGLESVNWIEKENFFTRGHAYTKNKEMIIDYVGYITR